MKKMLLTALIVLGTNFANAQEFKFGLTGGYTNLKQLFKFEGETEEDESIDGFFLGLNAEFNSNEQLRFAPSLIYSSYSAEYLDDRVELLQIPLMAKYYVAKTFNLQAGPQVNYFLEDDDIEDFSNISIGLSLGAGLDFNDKISLNLIYHIQVSNSYTGEYNDDFFIGNNTLNAGLNYYF